MKLFLSSLFLLSVLVANEAPKTDTVVVDINTTAQKPVINIYLKHSNKCKIYIKK